MTSTATTALTPIDGLPFTYDLTVGGDTDLQINHWTGALVRVDEEGHDWGTGITVTGKHRDGGVTPWSTRQGALNYAKGLQSLRWPGEDVYVITHVGLPENDGEPTRYTYFVAGPIRTGLLEEA
jgi:hypothetical protein